MIDGRRVILTTFAGRADRMKLLVPYVRVAIAAGVIDEWHVWDFARKAEDRIWLEQQFPVRRRLADKLEYRGMGEFSTREAGGYFEFSCRGKNDLHLRLSAKGDGGLAYEIIFGGWTNTRCAIRTTYRGAQPGDGTEIFNFFTPGLLSEHVFKTFSMKCKQDKLTVAVNGQSLFSVPVELNDQSIQVEACSGYGADCEILLAKGQKHQEFLFGSKNAMPEPFGEFYNFYCTHYADYKDVVFLKCDDDIVYFDNAKLSDFIKFRIENPDYFIVSANIINNGVCAYFQQQMDLIPLDLMQLELPPGGLKGKLLSDGEWTRNLHEHFLASPERFTKHDYRETVIEWSERLSINLISWLGSDLADMGCHYQDDENALSVDVPNRLGRVNAIYAPFIASHLSFWSQDNWFNVPEVIEKYEILASSHS